MKKKTDIFGTVVIVISLLSVLYGVSCFSGNGRAMPLLETADSLMDSEPQAALQVLSSIADGKGIRMSRSERAYYLLLMAEADYRCGNPLVRDTLVREAVQFFRGSAQQGLYARALLMQGAVYQEMADTLSALESCWNAVPANDESGRREALGVMRSIVGNMCGLMSGGDTDQYTAAIDSLGRSDGVDRAARTCLYIARGLSAYSAGQAEDNIAEGMEIARKEVDEEALLLGERLLGRRPVLADSMYAGDRMDMETLRLMGLMLENENLRVQAMEAEVSHLTSLLILAAVLFAALAVSGVLYLRLRRLRLENSALKASIGTFDPAGTGASVIVDAGGEAGAEMEAVLRDMVSLIGEMNEACGRDGDEGVSSAGIRKILDKYFPENEVYGRIRRICDLLYPGVLSGIEREHPSLTRNDILLIALMACGFPTGAICAVRRLNVHSLNVQKTRTARKIAPGLRLADYISEKFQKSVS